MRSNRRTPASAMALGGVLAALAVVIMSMGTLIPIATYACPVLCCMLLQLVLKVCGRRMAWAWYGAVTVLSVLLAPDKEAAFVFGFLGYYPILKPKLDRMPAQWLWKALLFNLAVLSMYWLLMRVLGLTAITEELAELGLVMTGILLLLGNVLFFLLDKLLGKKPIK